MKQLSLKLKSLVIFRNLLEDAVIKKLCKAINLCEQEDDFIENYCAFVASLYSAGTDNLSNYILTAAIEQENIYIKMHCKGTVNKNMHDCLQRELKILQELSNVEFSKLQQYEIELPKYKTQELNFAKEYKNLTDNLSTKGFGVFAKHNVFTVKNSQIVPVKSPDTQQIEQLFLYESERNKVMQNTLALLQGKPAANVLLYGDAGTGKSSTVKAVANKLFCKGIRLIEVKKHQLFQIPDILETLSENPLKFILFIDDLSFTSHDDNFAALKAILEGSVSYKGTNLVVYATSNRRHLIKETFSQREGDDVHISETLQELMSLSARFGLAINYSKPDKDEYILIVNELAKLYEIKMSNDELTRKAETFALRGHGRSPRSAKQFVEQLSSEN